MATVHSVPLRQEHLAIICKSILNYHNHFGWKTRTSRLFTWCTRLQLIHLLAFLICFSFGLWPQYLFTCSLGRLKAPSSEVNASGHMYTLHQWAYAKRCHLPSTPNGQNIDSHIRMSIISTLLCLFASIWISSSISLFQEPKAKDLRNPYRWFLWGRKVLLMSVVSSILHQLASATACRPMEILFDLRHILMISIQLVGFVLCLCFSFFLGLKYALVKPVHRMQARLHR